MGKEIGLSELLGEHRTVEKRKGKRRTRGTRNLKGYEKGSCKKDNKRGFKNKWGGWEKTWVWFTNVINGTFESK